jgi:hypothetical protein
MFGTKEALLLELVGAARGDREVRDLPGQAAAGSLG